MIKNSKKAIAAVLVGTALMGSLVNGTVGVEAAVGDTYISLGANLTDEQRAQVLETFGVSEEELNQDMVVTVTNQEEHEVFGGYISEAEIGDISISSAMVTMREEGYGIHVASENVYYVTNDMYANALATAGIKDADVIVTSPIEVSGTAGLLGVMKAYSAMTGQPLEAENIDAASDELVTTGKLGESLGDPQKAVEVIAAVKEEVIAAEKELRADAATSSDGSVIDINMDKVNEIIDELQEKFDVVFSEEERESIRQLIIKYLNLDLDHDQLMQQVTDIYNKLKSDGIDVTKFGQNASGFFNTIMGWLEEIKGWFNATFG